MKCHGASQPALEAHLYWQKQEPPFLYWVNAVLTFLCFCSKYSIPSLKWALKMNVTCKTSMLRTSLCDTAQLQVPRIHNRGKMSLWRIWHQNKFPGIRLTTRQYYPQPTFIQSILNLQWKTITYTFTTSIEGLVQYLSSLHINFNLYLTLAFVWQTKDSYAPLFVTTSHFWKIAITSPQLPLF